MGLRVLLTNFLLSGRSGSELYVWDLANALLARGHHPVIYSPSLGPLAGRLRSATIPVTDDLASMSAVPDIVHGQHNHETLTALLHFPDTPAIRVCHGWSDEPPVLFPRIRRFVCVDLTVRDRLISEWGVPESRVQVLLNFVDLATFQPRPPLPAQPSRALVFSNAAVRHLDVVRRACGPLNLTVDAAGESIGAVADRPEQLLRTYDVVFAKARCALEALAVGCAVVLCDEAGAGPLVTSRNFDDLRLLNFGVRTLSRPLSPESIRRELEKYDAGDAAIVSKRTRETAGLDAAVDQLLDIYTEAIDEHRRSPSCDWRGDMRSAAAYLRTRGSAQLVEQSSRAHVLGLARQLYVRFERITLMRGLLPSRATARHLASKLRPR